MNNTELRTRYAALQFTAQHIHCLKKDDTDEILFDQWWDVHHQSYKGVNGNEALELSQRMMAMCLDS